MIRIILTFIVLLSFTINTFAKIDNDNSEYVLRETDNFKLILEKEDKEIILQEYTSQDSIEAVLYDNFIIYNGDQGGIGLYIYDIEEGESYLLNDPGNFDSAIFYYNFDKKNDKLYMKAGMEIASMPKICVYDLKQLSEVFKKNMGNIGNYLEISSDTNFPNLYNFTKKNDITYCTFDDDKYYYKGEFTDDQKIKYILCDDSLCEQSQYVGGEKYVSDWDGKNKELIRIVEEGEIEKDENLYIYSNYEPEPAKPPIKAKDVWPYAGGALVVLAGGIAIARRKKK